MSIHEFSKGERCVLLRVLHGEHAADDAISILTGGGFLRKIGGIGHRIVHGGDRYTETVQLSAEVLEDLRRLAPLSPVHLPVELALVERFLRLLPSVGQVACFDTAFHRDLPQVARRIPMSRRFIGPSMRRFGFHGLSCESVLDVLGKEMSSKRIVIAHLGSGSSVTAVQNFKSVDTTMGFTPLGGVVMATRPGDLDPGVLLFLLRNEEISLERLERELDEDSGLRGVSEISSDIQILSGSPDVRAREAIELFCYSVKKAIASLTVPLGGLDLLIFTGGVGENEPRICERIVAGLSYLPPFEVRVIAANEERVIARKTHEFLNRKFYDSGKEKRTA